ncbi:MAG: phosphoribosylformylglycinamidine synthase subunit PurL [Planctomycetales bacterium]|nr:phosphoribosylformylglycinamidine synthase subunit PurL [Planctomycetales bacterium]
MTLWEVDIKPRVGAVDRAGLRVEAEFHDLGGQQPIQVRTARGFLVQGDFDQAGIRELADSILADAVVESWTAAQVGDDSLAESPGPEFRLITVMPKPGVTDPVALSVLDTLSRFGTPAEAVCTLRKYWIAGLGDDEALRQVATKLLANESIEQWILGPVAQDHISLGTPSAFVKRTVPIREASEAELMEISKSWQLSLTLVEMRTIQARFQGLDRDPTDIELETIAQTWSEHCSHKTLAGRIAYRDERGERHFDNMLRETIFAATVQIRRELGDQDWCVSVFKDNAGIVKFDEQNHVCFKVETHNRPSAIEPYGGANTGIGGVIRDTLGTGLGAKPICNTDVFCFAPPDLTADQLPPGVLHPRRIMKGVVSGVRDYGNRMGIPTVNGAVYFDRRYIGNPLVFCGNVGLIPVDKASKEVQPGDLIVSIGGRTGRDGIHGATFSSAELTSESERLSGGAVQIGNAITEKMAMDVLLAARDRGLYNAVTDCGAGGFSSAVGEMGENIGAEVWLERAPLKYEGLTYTEIWISEAQERMVFAVPEKHWEEFEALCRSEDVEATAIGRFEPTGRLTLKYRDEVVGDLDMHFLHDGRPPVVREASYEPQAQVAMDLSESVDVPNTVYEILGSLNVASKHWVIRQYDHEVLGGSVIKPLVGLQQDGPSDAAVIRPVLDSRRGLAVSCGMNPHYGDLDPEAMAAAAIDEAVRNCVAVGADPDRIAILDNFCWGYTDRPETLGSLVRAALGCQQTAIALKTPFISGKDSLNNEFSYVADGERKTISIPSTLLISAIGQVDSVDSCVTMDLKEVGSWIYQIGATRLEMGGSHFGLVTGRQGGSPPTLQAAMARRIFQRIHHAITQGFVSSCHDMSEGGLAIAMTEMAFAGGLGAEIDLGQIPMCETVTQLEPTARRLANLFAESNSRFLVEVRPEHANAFEQLMSDVPWGRLGKVANSSHLRINEAPAGGSSETLAEIDLVTAKQRWLAPLDWN